MIFFILRIEAWITEFSDPENFYLEVKCSLFDIQPKKVYLFIIVFNFEFKNQLPCLRHSGSSNIATDHIRNILKGKGGYVKFESFNPVQVSLYNTSKIVPFFCPIYM